MPKDYEVTISRDKLPDANSEFGLTEEDFDLTNVKVWIDDVAVKPSLRERGKFVVKAKVADDGPQTIALTTDADKLFAVLVGEKIPRPPSKGREDAGDTGQTT
jgi:hypothetical protein